QYPGDRDLSPCSPERASIPPVLAGIRVLRRHGPSCILPACLVRPRYGRISDKGDALSGLRRYGIAGQPEAGLPDRRRRLSPGASCHRGVGGRSRLPAVQERRNFAQVTVTEITVDRLATRQRDRPARAT